MNDGAIARPTIVDADSHIVEPADIWTSRVAAKHRDAVPQVGVHPETGHHHWRIGSQWLWPVGHWGQAGSHEYPPKQPWEFEDIQRSAYDPRERLERMDEYGLDVQILYPNLIGFQAPLFASMGPELALECTRAYNDFLVEWCSPDPSRLIPIAMLPYWDREASVKEMERCIAAGHRGVLFANKFERVGLPSFVDPYWDPVYQAAQDLDVSINYHVGFAAPEISDRVIDTSILAQRDGAERPTDRAQWAAKLFSDQCALIGQLVMSGLCDRFPRLKFVSVETGFGHIPFYLEALDWHCGQYGITELELLPSEYFKRQCYGTFWFERTTLALLPQYPDNFMFSTDYPHPTSLSPGPCSTAERPADHVAHAFAHVDPDLAAKALSGNAATVYKLALDQARRGVELVG